MLLFCPTCSNILTVSRVPQSSQPDAHIKNHNRFECRSCPYQYVLDRRYYERRTLKRKEVDDILGGAGAWENVDKTDVQCPDTNCKSTSAFFYQLQIRSADEPMTSFYKCVVCARQWRE